LSYFYLGNPTLAKMMRYKITVVIGTRPEGIKLAPVVSALKRHPQFECRICVSGQHRQMLDQVLDVFKIVPDDDLNLMQSNQDLATFTSRAIEALNGYLERKKPDLIMVQGDTTTVFCAALAAFYHRVPVAHVEAGLRTGDYNAPWPEEANRVLTSKLSALHFAPTNSARDNLLREGISESSIFVTGNTVIDALFIALEKVKRDPPEINGIPEFLQPSGAAFGYSPEIPRMVLITGHRRESFGEGFESICSAIAKLAERFQNTHFIYPVHLNPNVREPVIRILGDGANGGLAAKRNIHLIEPLPYLSFIALMDRATMILTDSGGVQEEAPSLGKPVLVMRNSTERPEAVSEGCVKLVGTEKDRIVREVSILLDTPSALEAMSRVTCAYGDGNAAPRIIEACSELLGQKCHQ
jgi:UDP-N-acetylglucosamine 2-epimerase (non-hydrolysing)